MEQRENNHSYAFLITWNHINYPFSCACDERFQFYNVMGYVLKSIIVKLNVLRFRDGYWAHVEYVTRDSHIFDQHYYIMTVLTPQVKLEAISVYFKEVSYYLRYILL